ncbi:hypothetical protein RUM43_002530 [Polyplax serrata]|uniref:Uncharacterized protein n=1 Tax=Polyplax serrata TaxID=468196 RepID=A0AAN8NYY6_POLSC
MEDCRESLDGESVSGDADEVSSNLDIVELETRPSSSSTLFANATTTTQQIAALPRHVYQFFNKKMKPVFPAEQIVMDVKRLNINFTFMEKDKIDSKP